MNSLHQNKLSVDQLRQTLAAEKSLPDLSVPFSDYLGQVQKLAQDASPVSALTLDPQNATRVLRAGALFGGLLAATSRAELLKLAESGDVEAKKALQEIFGNRAIYPGTFDPFTLGHGDVARRAVKLFDHVIIGIGVNPGKKPLFSVKERIALIKKDLADLGDKVTVLSFEGSLVKFARELNCEVILRGIRSVTDYEQELQLALVNLTLSKGNVETLFIPAKEGASFVSSSIVKSVIKAEEDASSMVAPHVLEALQSKHSAGAL